METCHTCLYVTLALPLQGGEENDHFILWFLGILSYQGPIIQREQLSRTGITAFSPTLVYAPINVNPVGGGGGGGGGVRARGGDLTNFKIFRSNSPGWETKGQSKVSKKPPPQGKKSKQTML